MGRAKRWDAALQGCCVPAVPLHCGPAGLASLWGDLPWPLVVDSFNRWAAGAGRPLRTESALLRMCERRRIPRRTVGAWITTSAIKELAKISETCVLRWIRTRELPVRKFHNAGIYYIRRVDLCDFAQRHPHKFGGIDLPSLIQLLDDEPLAEQIYKQRMPRLAKQQAVRCVETGRRYSSIREAARAGYVTPQRMGFVIKNPTRTANGMHWEVSA
jgi:hypothetical protein